MLKKEKIETSIKKKLKYLTRNNDILLDWTDSKNIFHYGDRVFLS